KHVSTPVGDVQIALFIHPAQIPQAGVGVLGELGGGAAPIFEQGGGQALVAHPDFTHFPGGQFAPVVVEDLDVGEITPAHGARVGQPVAATDGGGADIFRAPVAGVDLVRAKGLDGLSQQPVRALGAGNGQ